MARARKVSVKGAARREQQAQKRAMKDSVLSVPTIDSFQNFISQTGIGTNNQSSYNTYGLNPISQNRNIVEWMYRGSWVCAKAVDCVADDMTREGIELTSELSPDEVENIQEVLTRTDVWGKINLTLKWSRLYGGAIAVVLIDGQDMSTPLRPKLVAKGAFKGLQVMDRWMVDPSLEDLITTMGPDIGQPRFYRVVSMAPAFMNMKIHHSRVIRLEGVDLPYWQKLTLNLWGASVLEQMYDRLTMFDSITQGAAQLAFKAHLRTLSVENLRQIVATGGDAYRGLLRQVEAMRLFQTNEGISIIDGKDKFESHQYGFAGLGDMMLQVGQQIAGATGIPLVRLFGQSPAGLNSTGESDLRNYYDGVKHQQKLKLQNPLHMLLEVVAASERIKLPDDFGFMFRPLWQLTAKEKAEVADIKTRTVLSARDSSLASDQLAMRELKSQSVETGVWTSITDEDINSASDEPPKPEELLGSDNPDVKLNLMPDKVPTMDEVTFYMGLPIKIETAKGAVRKSRDPNNPWQVVMPADYGEIIQTEGADGDCVDVFLGPDRGSRDVWVVNQIEIGTRQFDEHKALIGFPDYPSALAAYLGAFSDNRAHERLGSVVHMTLREFQSWLRTRGPLYQIKQAAE